jgi:hypothetical protein
MPQEYPSQSYYPGARVAFIVRLDNPYRKRFNRNKATLPMTQTSSKYPEVLDIVNEGGALRLVPKSVQGAQKNKTAKKGTPFHLSVPNINDDPLTQVISGVIPNTASLALNGIRSASTLTLEIPFSALPIEPRMVRGVGVEFYLGTVTASDFARGIAGDTREAKNGAEPLNIIPENYTDAFGRPRSNLRFSGWVDEWEVVWGESQPMVRLQCRDNTAILIDTQAPALLALDPKIPLDQAFAKYLARFPQFAGLSVKYLPESAKAPTYREVTAKAAFNPRFGAPQFMANGQGSVMDYFADVAGALGLIVRSDPSSATIIIQQPRSIYGDSFPTRDDDPFGRTTESGLRMPYRMFVFGRNVLDLTMKRKYTVAGPTTIEVRSYDPVKKRNLVVRYPYKAERLERGLPGSILPDEKIQQFFQRGITDQKTLHSIAQGIYEQLGRNEIELNVKTRNLGSFGGSALDPDLLDCKVGDTIQFEVTADAQTGELNAVNAVESAQRQAGSAKDYVQRLGYSDRFAEAYAEVMRNALLLPYFRVKRMDFNWDIERGIDVAVTGINYIGVRGDALEDEPKPSAQEIAQRKADVSRTTQITQMAMKGGDR